MSRYSEIAELLEVDESRLYQRIGTSVLGSPLGMKLPDVTELIVAGKDWFRGHYAALRAAVCGSNFVVAYRSSKRAHDRVLLVAAIADLIASVTGGVTAISVAVLIVKEGLDTFCPQPER
jgi:hypothetical protein